MVYGGVCTKQRAGGLVDSTAMVCDSFYHTGYRKIRAGSVARSAVREDNSVYVRRQTDGISI